MCTKCKWVNLMKCLKRVTLLDFLNNELSKEESSNIKTHLETCEKCKTKLNELDSEISVLKSNLKSLNPEFIPDIKFNLLKQKEQRKKSIYKKISFPIFSPKFGFAMVGLVLLLISSIWVIILKEDDKFTIEEIQQMTLVEEYCNDDDPKRDWNEKRILITIFDNKNNTAEIIKTSIEKSKIDREVFQLESTKE